MKKQIYFFSVVLFLLTNSFKTLQAQNNLQVEFLDLTTVPDFLNVCGDPDMETVLVSLDGLSPDIRSNIFATANLFQGVEFVSIDLANSTPGVALVDASDVTKPVFSLPDMGPSGITDVEIRFSIRANCNYLDTLFQNGAIEVFDVWDFTYDLGATTNLQESDNNVEYKNSLVYASLDISVLNTYGFTRVGDCYSRDVTVNNTGLLGYLDQIEYTNVQNDGIYITDILVNGIPTPVTKTFDPVSGDTIITATIDGTQFVNNTGTGANGDIFLGQNETVTITENFCVLVCSDDRRSRHSVTWGCDGNTCVEESDTHNVFIGEGTPSVIYDNFGTIPNANTGYCQPGVTTFTVSNNGVEVNAGFATMVDVGVGFGLGIDFDLLAENGYTITQIEVAGLTLPPGITYINLAENPLVFGVDPDGPGGLSDFDNDGYFDDLQTLDSFEIVAYFEFDCTVAQSTSDECANIFKTNMGAKVDFTNACLVRLETLGQIFNAPSHDREDVNNFTDPDAFVERDTFLVTHTQERRVRFFDRSCSNQEEFQIAVAIPSGVFPVISETILKTEGSAIGFPLKSNTISNDTLYLNYDAAFQSINQTFELILAFEANCTATLGPTTFPTEFSFYCPDCDCKHLWYCGELSGPQLHAEIPPCPPSVFNCDTGIQSMNFSVNRTTFGYTDNTFTTPVDPSTVNQKVALSCDSVQMTLTNIVGSTPITDSIGMVINYNNPDGSLDVEEIFIFDYATVRIVQSGTEFLCTVDTSVLSVVAIDSVKILTFDLNECLVNLGIGALTLGDSIQFIGNFSVNPEGPYDNDFTIVPNFRGYGYARVDGTDYACDNFGENFYLSKIGTTISIPSSNSNPEGCEETFLRYEINGINAGFDDLEWFPNEYRKAVKVDSIVFNFDPAVFEGFSFFEPEVSVHGHPIHGSSYFPMTPFDSFPSGVYVARFDTLSIPPSLNESSGSYAFSFRVRVVPNCRSLFGSSNNNNCFQMDPRLVYLDRYYADEIGDGSCVDSIEFDETRIICYDEPPILSFQSIEPDLNLKIDTAVWEFNHCNTSVTVGAGLTWIALEDTTGVIEVVSMELIDDPLNPVPLTFVPYGTNGNKYFAYTEGLEQGDGMSTLEEICNLIRVKALVTACGITNLTARSGWNCVAYPEVDWNPELYPPCEEENIALSVNTLDPFLDAFVTDQPSTNPEICDTSSITILVRNTGQGSTFDMVSQFIIPLEGATLVPGSFEVAYPSDTTFVTALADPTNVGVNTRGIIYEYTDFSNLNSFLDNSGLPGFDASNPDSNYNEFKIRYRFITDCNFRSGSISYYSFQGVEGCGDTTNIETGETFPITVQGGEPDPTKIFEIFLSGDTTLTPAQPSPLEITIVNRTTTPSDTTDKVLLLIPGDIAYDANSTTLIQPGSWALTEPQIEITSGGFQQLYWCLPVGMVLNDTARFSISLTPPDYDCDTDSIDVGLHTILRKDLTCSTGGMCTVETVSSTNGNDLTTLRINQRVLNLDLTSITSNCDASNAEQVNVVGNIINSVFPFPNVNFDIKYYYDDDANGIYDGTEVELASFTESGPLTSGEALPIDHSFLADQNQLCNILLRIDSTGLGLCDHFEFAFPAPTLQNAGTDELFCTLTPTTINLPLGDPDCNALLGYGYNWTAIAPATLADLSQTDIPDPILNVPHDGITEDTLRYVLETTRPSCGAITRDTVTIIRANGVDVVGNSVEIAGGSSVSLMPTVTGGTMPYSYNWEPAGTLDDPTAANPVATPIADTDYIVTVTTATGCTDVDTIQVTLASPVIAVVNPSDTTICNNQSVQLLASGGTDYLWVPNPGNPTTGNLNALNIANPIFSNGVGGVTYNYEVIVSDVAFPGITDTATVTINTLVSPIVVTGVGDLEDCVGDTVPVSIQIDQNILSYTISGTGVFNNDVIVGANTLTFNAIYTGVVSNFTVSLIGDTDACPVVESFAFRACGTPCPPLDLNGITVVETTCGNSDGRIDLMLVGDPANYTYEWSPDIGTELGSGEERIDLPFGGYSITVTSASNLNCVTVLNAFVPNSDGPTASVETTAASCQAADGTASLSPSNYTYDWGFGTGSSLTGLSAGIYYPTVTNPANPTCSNVVEVIIQEDNPLLADVNITTQPDCGVSNGSASINVANGSGSYSFFWADGNTNQARTDLGAGIYSITITDDGPSACEIPFIFVLTDDVPAGAVTIDNINNVTCPGAANGGIEFSIVFDPAFVAPADTIISDGFATYENGSLPAGNYCLEIIDGNGCVAGGECFTIEAPDPVLLDFILVDECDGAPGSIELLVSGGTGTYQFDWSDLAGSNNPQHRGSLSAGTYTVIVTDANGCISTNTVVIELCPNSCETATIVGTTATMATCGNADGSAIITVTGDPNDYNFTWSPNVGVQGVGVNTRTNLSFGGYSVTIANVSDPACFTVTEILIANSDGPQATFTKTPATCQASDGSASLTPTTFNYTWFDAATVATRSDLASGVYFVTVVDPANPTCPNVIEILIEEDNPLEATAEINAQPDCNENNGSVTINVTGGTNYTFLWEDNVTTQTRTDLAAGIHRVTVSDSDPTTMCELPFIFILTDNVPAATVTIDSVIHISCPGETNGGIEYTVNFDPAFAAPADTLISNSFTLFENGSLGVGVYCIELRDNNNCVAGGACFEIEAPDPIDVQIALTPDCNAGGTVDLIIAGGTGPYTVDWADINGIDDPVNRVDLQMGTYDFTILDANNCSYANQTAIEACPCTTPTLNSVVMVESTCGNEDGMITINLVEAAADYEYTWSPDLGTSIGDGNTRVNLPFGGYTVSISEPGITNCILAVPVVVVNSDGPTASASTTPATCQAADGTATLLPATLTYLWEDNIEANTRTDLSAGSYFVTITDPNTPDCANAILVEVLSENPLEAIADVTTKPDCNASNGVATINVTNGSGNYTYLWADGVTTQSRSDLASGIHMVTITDTDASMCALPFLFVVTDNVAEGTVVLDSVININCFGAANGGIEFTINFDPSFVAPADTVITDGVTNFTNGALPTGDYCMIITDANDCVGGGICFTIETPDALDLHFAVQPACDTLGTIDVTVNGGTPDFNFDWDDIVGTTDEEDRDSLATGDYSLTVTDANGCVISESSVTVPVCPDNECDFFSAQDSLTIETEDCGGLTNLCLNLPLEDLLNFNITVNGAPYTGIFPGCSFDTTGSYQYIDLVNSVGPFEVNGWTVDGNMFSSGTFITPSDLVDSMNIWDPMGEWSISTVGAFIIGGASGSDYGTLFVKDLTTQAIFEFQYNSALLATNYGLELPLGDNEVIITNTTGCSDTLMTSVVCVNPDTIYITILEEEMDTVCFNDLELMGAIDTLYNYCALDNVEIEILEDTSCVVFTGVLIGFDTACIVACDTFGICDTTFVIIEVIPDSSLISTDVVCDTIFINSEVVYCPDTTELQGNIVYFENICEEESDGEVNFYLSQDSLCVFYTGQALGQDSACIVMCDDLGECDTTYFCISVIEYLLPPIANDDYDTTLIGEPVVINVKANDVTLGGLDTFYIVNEPLYGTLGIPGSANGFNPDCTITYNASDEYCEREDYFTYAICNANGCDTATVYVWLECADIVIFTAVSPNRDGVNDVFFISGIEDFPNSELEIYNRWGNRVYQKVGYKNDWRGTWDGDKDLPDGTYYYLLQLNDPQDTRVFSGYLELYR